MVKITEQLVRKKSEHNEGVINTLEELSLHQEDVEKIEHIHDWCKNLQILYLQSNLISKIENLHKLKNLRYLNLAINNIEKIENLEGCESLEKLDLTLNFIGEIESVCSLQLNTHLKHLYLTGNPCTDFKGYRQYVIAKLPQLETLDTEEITRSERIKALQVLNELEMSILGAQEQYKSFREQQKVRLLSSNAKLDDEEFWKTSSEHAPEVRIEIARRAKVNKNKDQKLEKKTVKLFNQNGQPLNINQIKVDFKFDDSDAKQYVLDIAIYKHLDTSLIDVDLQPIVVKVVIKEKIFQFVLPEEIYVDRSVAQRSHTTGHLLITMPKVNYKKPLEINLVPNQKGKNVTRKEPPQSGHEEIADNFCIPLLEYG